MKLRSEFPPTHKLTASPAERRRNAAAAPLQTSACSPSCKAAEVSITEAGPPLACPPRDPPLQDGLQAGVVQQQVSRLQHLPAGVTQPPPQLPLQAAAQSYRLTSGSEAPQHTQGQTSRPQSSASSPPSPAQARRFRRRS